LSAPMRCVCLEPPKPSSPDFLNNIVPNTAHSGFDLSYHVRLQSLLWLATSTTAEKAASRRPGLHPEARHGFEVGDRRHLDPFVVGGIDDCAGDWVLRLLFDGRDQTQHVRPLEPDGHSRSVNAGLSSVGAPVLSTATTVASLSNCKASPSARSMAHSWFGWPPYSRPWSDRSACR